jgi:hypothetical protein
MAPLATIVDAVRKRGTSVNVTPFSQRAAKLRVALRGAWIILLSVIVVRRRRLLT